MSSYGCMFCPGNDTKPVTIARGGSVRWCCRSCWKAIRRHMSQRRKGWPGKLLGILSNVRDRTSSKRLRADMQEAIHETLRVDPTWDLKHPRFKTGEKA